MLFWFIFAPVVKVRTNVKQDQEYVSFETRISVILIQLLQD